jgi:ribosome-binding ATPase YchF (GTP1/OBG family)
MGKGLGNRFLDDLRHADALVHVVDVSGTTDAEGMSGVGRGGLLRRCGRIWKGEK